MTLYSKGHKKFLIAFIKYPVKFLIIGGHNESYTDEYEIKMIDIRDLIRNKESLNRSDEKAYWDKYDIEVLKKMLKKKSK